MSKVLPRGETTARVGLHYTTIWRLMKRGEFPMPVQLSDNRIGWLEAEIDDWIARRVAARDAGVVAMRQPPQRKRKPVAT